MRCKACNEQLNDREATRKGKFGYEDMCNSCLKPIVNDIAASLPPDDPLFDEVLPWDEDDPTWS